MKKYIITAGGTSERIDNVRKITNSSSGRLGKVIAEKILEADPAAFIYYVCSKNSFRPIDDRVCTIEINGTVDLKGVIRDLLISQNIDCFIHSMAVSDYMVDYVTSISRIKDSLHRTDNIDEAFSHVEVLQDSKISSQENQLVIVLKPTVKIISLIKDISPSTYLVGFKLLDGVSYDELIRVASDLREKNSCDLVVANDLSTIRSGKHIAYILDGDDSVEMALGKDDIAKKLIKRVCSDS